MGIYGIDVSSYQPEHFPTTVQGHQVSFAFIKATEGASYVNPRMNGQAAWARSHGHIVGFYHFIQPGNMKSQAARFVSQAVSVEGDVLALDWEVTGVSSAQKDEFLREVKRLRPTHRVILYCSQNYWLTRDKSSYCADGLWLANYNGHPGQPGVQHPVLIHQYTSSPVDTNYSAEWPAAGAMKSWARGLLKSDEKPATPPSKPVTTPAKVDSMKLDGTLSVSPWAKELWADDKGLTDGTVTDQTALVGAYLHARYAHEHVAALEAKVDALTELVKRLVP